MKHYLRCVSAEFLKTRRTIHLLAAIVLPTILVLFNFLLVAGLQRKAGYYDIPNGWVHFEHNTITFWAILVLPFLLVLVCAFMAHQEHDTKQWRRLMCLPVPRAPLYLAKMTLVVAIMFFSSALIWVENILVGWVVTIIKPELGLSMDKIALWDMLVPYLVVCLFALLLAAIHLWFSMRVENFVLSIGMGLALILAGFFLNEIEIVRMVFPWSLPAMVYKAGDLLTGLIGLAYSLVGWAALTAAGSLDFSHQDFLA